MSISSCDFASFMVGGFKLCHYTEEHCSGGDGRESNYRGIARNHGLRKWPWPVHQVSIR
jgi:hypothetical protein